MRAALEMTGCEVVEIGVNSGGLNILDWIDASNPEADAHVRSVVEWIYDEGAASKGPGTRPGDPFWSMRGREIVTCILAHIVYADPGSVPRNLTTVRRFLRTPEAEMPQLLAGIHRGSAAPAWLPHPPSARITALGQTIAVQFNNGNMCMHAPTRNTGDLAEKPQQGIGGACDVSIGGLQSGLVQHRVTSRRRSRVREHLKTA
jgi:hypothetical protein